MRLSFALNRSQLKFICSLSLLLVSYDLTPVHGMAATLASMTNIFGSSGGGIDFGYQPAAAIVLHYGDLHINDFSSAIFTSKNWTNADVGSSYTINALNDPNFTTFVAILTNGTNDLVWRRTVPVGLDGKISVLRSGGSGAPESLFLENLFAGSNGIDLSGAVVTSIVATLNSGSFSVGPMSYSYSGSITYTFIGIIPEPTGMVLLTVGFGAALMRRRRAGWLNS